MNNQVVSQAKLANGIQLQLVQGDITEESVDAIVNAANEHLQHGGGVAAAIAKAGGPVIQRQSNQWVQEHGPIAHDRPAVTDGGDLPCRYLIHVVGPRWGEGKEAVKLRQAVDSALSMAEEKGCHSIALPAISTGIFGYPVEEAATVIIEAIVSYAQQIEGGTLKQVRITIIDEPTLNQFRQALDGAR